MNQPSISYCTQAETLGWMTFQSMFPPFLHLTELPVFEWIIVTILTLIFKLSIPNCLNNYFFIWWFQSPQHSSCLPSGKQLYQFPHSAFKLRHPIWDSILYMWPNQFLRPMSLSLFWIQYFKLTPFFKQKLNFKCWWTVVNLWGWKLGKVISPFYFKHSYLAFIISTKHGLLLSLKANIEF